MTYIYIYTPLLDGVPERSRLVVLCWRGPFTEVWVWCVGDLWVGRDRWGDGKFSLQVMGGDGESGSFSFSSFFFLFSFFSSFSFFSPPSLPPSLLPSKKGGWRCDCNRRWEKRKKPLNDLKKITQLCEQRMQSRRSPALACISSPRHPERWAINTFR